MMRFAPSYSVLAALIVFGSNQVDVARAQTPSALKDQYRRPPARQVENKALVELGRELFADTQLSASGKTACLTCHLPDAAWSVLEARSTNDAGKLTSRKPQTLVGIGHASSPINGWDGRNPTLEAQAKSSVATGSMSMRETPTPVAVEVIEQRFRSNPAYVAKFNAALPGAPINIDTIVQAVAAFERTIEPEQAPFDRWIAGDENAISPAAKRGFELFNGKGLCFACHGGWRFTDDKFHDIGTTTTDRGRGVTLKDDPQMQFAFKTPTLRSVALRPPYMHNGSSATLEDVVRHYEKGGIDRPSRSPLMQSIKLTDQERGDLVAFMETLGPSAATGAIPRNR
jgi:cytochrome c peroxidase